MTTKPKILLLSNIAYAPEAWESLSPVADLIKPKSTAREAFIKDCQDGAYDGVVAAYTSNGDAKDLGNMDDELCAALPGSLKYICHNGAGYDRIDIAACTKRSVLVSNTPNAVDDATADTAIFLLLGALRNFAPAIAGLRQGTWRGNMTLGHDPQGKTLGILGMGGIGRNMARKARVFGMNIRYHNRKRLDPDMEEGAEYVSFETLLKESHVLSLNLPLNPHTRHIISTPQFAMMKPGIVIINTARGAVMDEAALVEALASGQVASVGLDVFENEPEVHPDLLINDNVLLVPHVGTATVETNRKMELMAFDNIKTALEQGKLMSLVPEQKNLV